MPVLVTLATDRPARRRFTDESSAVAGWQLVHREADRLYPELRTLWNTLFTDLQGTLDDAALREALERGSLAQAEGLIRAAWGDLVDGPARRLLPMLVRQAAERTAEAVLAETAVTIGTGVKFSVVVPETLQAIETYVGAQIVAIEQTTLQAVRAVIRQGFEEGLSLTKQMDALEKLVGLTPSQVQRIERLRERLTQEGLSAVQVRQQVDAASRKALALRVEAIARTESITAASMGQQELWRQSERQGFIDDSFKRYWIVTPDDRLCPICRAIPGLNPQGVGLEEPFQTPVGPVLHPVAHVQCRCAVSLRRTV